MDSQNEPSNKKDESNCSKLKDIFAKVKSYYILQEIFNDLQKKKLLEIIKYNKKIQKRLNININNYKDYCETYSSIEIEITPTKNEYGKFINIRNKEDKKYYHIYFNNNKEEIKRYELYRDDKVTKIYIIIDYQIQSFFKLFAECKCIESINFKKFYRNNINNMSYMFWECKLLKEINLNSFNTYNVTNMSYMFCLCSSLEEINLSNFSTNNVTDMRGMFSQCSSLKGLNLSNFNTNEVIDMTYMFYDCSSLKEINLSDFIIDTVPEVEYMFYGLSDKLKAQIRTQFENLDEKVFEKEEKKLEECEELIEFEEDEEEIEI